MAMNQTDWRVGKAVTPKMRSHRYFGFVGVVRGVIAGSPSIRESLIIEMPTATDAGGFAGWRNSPPAFDEPSDDWMTA